MRRSPARVHLTVEEEATLRGWTRTGTAEQRLVDRSKIILLSREGVTVEKIRPATGYEAGARFRSGGSGSH
jgi:hypothetical protein